MKLLNPRERAVISKDLREIWSARFLRGAMIAFPICMAVVVPGIFLTAAYMTRGEGMGRLAGLLPENFLRSSPRQAAFYLMTELAAPLFFLMIPLMTSAVASASAFAGEKERGTLETLRLTPMSADSIFRAKLLGALWLSFLDTSISFAAFSVVVGVGDLMLRMPFFFNWSWLAMTLAAAPALTLLGAVFLARASSEDCGSQGALQLSGYIVLPLILLFLGQYAGLYRLNGKVYLAVAGLALGLGAALLPAARRAFSGKKRSKSEIGRKPL